ncbi:hypothetical protein AAHA92_28109 [Salvia divinorum]|uniref:Gem-associated protein 2 n=1 Tax=Salvia divinorum TaxID=28513 RepID=A0ABD1FU01_SALDI
MEDSLDSDGRDAAAVHRDTLVESPRRSLRNLQSSNASGSYTAEAARDVSDNYANSSASVHESAVSSSGDVTRIEEKKQQETCYSNEKREKKRVVYSREELEALRFDNLEEQKKIYCGRDVAECKGLDRASGKESIPAFDFDPRPQFHKSATMGEPDFDSGPPLDGLEYLKRVRWEAARMPKVKIAKDLKINKIKEQSVYMPQIPDVIKCPENLLPLKEWEDSFLSEFSQLREAFAGLDLQGLSAETSTDEGFLTQMVERTVRLYSVENSRILETGDAKFIPSYRRSSVDRPTLSAILKMDSATRTSLLIERVDRVVDMDVDVLPYKDSLWLFALCAAVDCPLHADTSAALRSLLRKCASLRAAKTEIDDQVIVLNILVTVAGKYFGQLEPN